MEDEGRHRFRPELVSIPKRFTEITTWKGQIDSVFLNGLKDQYASAILALAAPEMNKLTETVEQGTHDHK